MANWSEFVNGDTVSGFDADNDVLNFDDLTISAAAILVEGDEVSTTLTYNGKTVTLDISPLAITSANITFDDGSQLIVGDDTTGEVNDDDPNTLAGGSGGDQLIGGEGADTMDGADGHDVIAGNGGSDLIDGGGGNDTIDGLGGADTLRGGDGDDHYVVDVIDDGGLAIEDTLEENPDEGTDTVELVFNGAGTPGAFSYTLGDGFENLLLYDGEGTPDDTTWDWNGTGNALDNLIVGTGGENSLAGGDGNDTLGGAGGNDGLDGGAGDDSIDGGAGNDTVIGSTGRDSIDGGGGNDLFTGVNFTVSGLHPESTAFFEGGAGNDTLIGATADGLITLAVYKDAGTGVVVNLGTGTAQDGEGGTDKFVTTNNANVDGVIGSMFNDSIVGGGNARSIGGGLNERFEGLAGHDTINGGSGADQALYIQSPNAVRVNLSAQAVEMDGVMVAAGTARDGWDDAGAVTTVTGYTDRLISINIAIGSANNDTFYGGVIDEQFDGRGGDDFINGGDGLDAVRYFQATGGVAVNLGADDVDLAAYGLETQIVAGGTASGIGGDNGVGVDTFVKIEEARGSDFDDVLIGGGAGLVEAGAGIFQHAEMFEGLAGNDTLDGGDDDPATLDFASYERDPSGVIVNLGSADILFGDYTITGGHALDGYAVDDVRGIDTLIGINAARGSRWDDTLVGGNGDQVFQGGAGNDSLVGGAGSDTLEFDSAASGVIVNMFGVGSSTISVFGVSVIASTARDGQGGVDTISGFENVIGSGFNDYIQGGNGSAGGAGNRLEGEAGNDTLIGSGNSETLAGAHQNDTLLGGDGDDVLRQGRGHDVIDGGDQVSADRLEFIGGMNYGTGVGQASVLVDLGVGTSNADRLNSDSVNGVGGDTATVSGIEFVVGTAGSDILIGGSLAHNASGGLQERFRGSAGNDTIDGQGSGFGGRGFNDQVEYDNATGGVRVDLAAGTAQGIGGDNGVGVDKLSNINWVRGSDFSDVLIGSDTSATGRVERFEARGGSDTIDGGAGIDEVAYIQSPNGVNVNLQTGIAFDGFGGTDSLLNIEGVRGSDNNDVLTGSNRLDVIERFRGEEGDDTINGGAGIDFAVWLSTELAEGGVNVFIESGVVSTVDDGFGFTDTLQNIEGLEGTNSGDTLAGGAGEQWFRGRGGDDRLSGGAGTDWADYSLDHLEVIVNMGTSAVHVNAGHGLETVAAGTARDGFGGVYDLQGTDTLAGIENVLGSVSGDFIAGSSGANLLDGNLGNDTLNGGAGNDTLVGNGGNDRLDGGAGNDTLDGGAGNDFQDGGAGEDLFTDSTGNDTLEGGTEDDTFLVNYTSGTITAKGEGGSDTWVLNPDAIGTRNYKVLDFDNVGTGAGRDYIDVGALLDASAKAGYFTGQDPFASKFLKFVNAGNDKVLQWDLSGGGDKYVNVITLAGLGGTAVTDDSFKGYVAGSGKANKLVGGAEDDSILGLAGDDTISGGAGDDHLYGGDGVDSMAGGSGDDTYEVDNVKDKVVEKTANGATTDGEGAAGLTGFGDTVIASINFSLETMQFVEHVRLAGSATQATGNALNNLLVGNGGDDTLTGGGGNDTLDGGAGKDKMDGGTGNDVFFVNDPGDVVKETSTGGTDTVQSTISEKLDGNVENLVLLGKTAINGTGNTLGNRITGNGNKNTLVGDAGNDTLDGGAGADSLNGGAGNDLYIVDSTGDRIATDTGGADTVQSTVDHTMAGGIENLVLMGNLAIDGTGNTGANRITGNGNDNLLNGGDGADTLEGGTGNDTLNGGTGLDADSLIGGTGNDLYFVDMSTDKVVETSSAGGHDVVLSTATFTLSGNVEALVLTGNGVINGIGNTMGNGMSGNEQANVLNGSSGNDTISGNGGGDTIVGGLDQDLLFGGSGTDSLNGGDGNDSLDGGDDSDALLGGNGQDSLDGGFGADNLNGGDGNDSLDGGDDNDALLGGEGQDLLYGGSGADNLNGGDGNDSVVGGGDANDALLGGEGQDSLDGGSGADNLDGGEGDDWLIWDADDATAGIHGGGGDDILAVNGSGNDLDFTVIDDDKISGLNEVHLSGDGANSLTLAAGDVLAQDPAAAEFVILNVVGDSDDTVNLAGGGWDESEDPVNFGTEEDPHLFVEYTQTLGLVQLSVFVDEAVMVNILPS